MHSPITIYCRPFSKSKNSCSSQHDESDKTSRNRPNKSRTPLTAINESLPDNSDFPSFLQKNSSEQLDISSPRSLLSAQMFEQSQNRLNNLPTSRPRSDWDNIRGIQNNSFPPDLQTQPPTSFYRPSSELGSRHSSATLPLPTHWNVPPAQVFGPWNTSAAQPIRKWSEHVTGDSKIWDAPCDRLLRRRYDDDVAKNRSGVDGCGQPDAFMSDRLRHIFCCIV